MRSVDAALTVTGVIQILRVGSVTGQDLEIKISREGVETAVRLFVSVAP
jgi:hypothetical protein